MCRTFSGPNLSRILTRFRFLELLGEIPLCFSPQISILVILGKNGSTNMILRGHFIVYYLLLINIGALNPTVHLWISYDHFQEGVHSFQCVDTRALPGSSGLVVKALNSVIHLASAICMNFNSPVTVSRSGLWRIHQVTVPGVSSSCS